MLNRDQVGDLRQVMVIMLRDKICEVEDLHGSFEPGVQGGSFQVFLRYLL